jgi:hypothetical protein
VAHKIMIYQSENDLRLQRRIRFSAHIAAYVLLCLAQSALMPYDLLALSMRAFFFMTIIMHVAWLCNSSRPLLQEWQPVPQPIPLLPERVQQPDFQQNDFWYRWHDLS